MCSGTVYKDIHSSYFLNEGRNLVQLCDVEGTIRAPLAQLLLGHAQLLLIAPNNNHLGTCLNKHFGNAETIFTPSATGNCLYLSLPLILERVVRREAGFTSRIWAIVSSS